MLGAAAAFLMRTEPTPETPVIPQETVTVAEVAKKMPPAVAKPAFVSIELSTTPAGAQIFHGSEDTGKVTPALIALPVGAPVDLTFKLKDYRDYEAQIVPEKGMAIESKLIRVTEIDKPATKHGTTIRPKPEPKSEPKSEPKPEPTVVPDPPNPKVDRLVEDDVTPVELL